MVQTALARFGLAACIATGSAQDAATDPQPARYSFREMAMGCEMRIELYAPSESVAGRWARSAFDRVHQLDAVLSDYRVTSEVSRLPAVASRSVPVGRDLAQTLQRSLRLSRATAGRFDPTTGATSQLWRRARRSGVLPSDSEIDQANACGGFEQIALADDGATLSMCQAGIQLDFGAIGKGLAAQAAIETLRALGAHQAMCAIAGDIACGDPPPDTLGWIVEIACGIPGAPPRQVRLHNQSISTSGDEVQHLDVDGLRHSHIYDPRTGRAVTRRIAATVISPDGAVADALATALCVDGGELLKQQVRLRGEVGAFEAEVVELGTRDPTVAVTIGWESLLVSPPEPAAVDQIESKAASDSSGSPAPPPRSIPPPNRQPSAP